MAQLDPRFGPDVQHRTVTKEYLDELYATIAAQKEALRAIEDEREVFASVDHLLTREQLARLNEIRAGRDGFVSQPPRYRIPTPPRDLSPRELEVLQHVGNGHRDAEIARRLGISPATVNDHWKKILTKLRASNRAHAFALAFRAGLVQ